MFFEKTQFAAFEVNCKFSTNLQKLGAVVTLPLTFGLSIDFNFINASTSTIPNLDELSVCLADSCCQFLLLSELTTLEDWQMTSKNKDMVRP